MTARKADSPYVEVQCPACFRKGSAPGIRRHITMAHTKHRSPRDIILNVTAVRAGQLDVVSEYSKGGPRATRATTKAGLTRYATLISPAAAPVGPVRNFDGRYLPKVLVNA